MDHRTLYLYFCRLWRLFTLIFPLLLLIMSRGPSSSRPPHGDASFCSVVSWIHTLYIYYIIVCQSICQCKLEALIWFCSVLKHLLHICLSWQMDPPLSAGKIHFINGVVVLLYWEKQAYITVHTTQQVACELEDCLYIIKLKKNL